METSVVVVGGDDFLNKFLKRIRSLISGSLRVASRLEDVVQLISAQPTDILILQQSNSSRDICRRIKEQQEFVATYCIILEERPMLSGEQMRSWQNQELIAKITALEHGADAYLWMTSANELEADGLKEELILQDRLLTAQIQIAGLRMQQYRELMRTNDLLSSIALADPLTEVNNRRALEWDLPRQVQKARTLKLPLSLIILDVDFFKSINDNYGHLIGDRVLQLLASRMQHNLRVQDTLFRYGGEEFVILLSLTGAEEANIVANRLCQVIGDNPFTIDETLTLTVTISIGGAFFREEDDSKGVSLLHRADENLRKAKSGGRNRVITEL